MALYGACGWRSAALVAATPGAAMAMTQYRPPQHSPPRVTLSTSTLAIMITNTHMQALRWVVLAGHNNGRSYRPNCRNKTE